MRDFSADMNIQRQNERGCGLQGEGEELACERIKMEEAGSVFSAREN